MKIFVVCAVFISLLNGCKSGEQESASASDEQESRFTQRLKYHCNP